MIAFLLPFAIVIGVITFARGSRSAPAVAVSGGTPNPSPIAVLCVFLRDGHTPPAFLVRCAIAEAQLNHRADLVETFGALVSGAPRITPRRMVTSPPLIVQPPTPADVPDWAQPEEPAQREVTQTSAPDVVPPAGAAVAPPISGVDHGQWMTFCGALARESPMFTSARHVGRYRHRKDRLAEVGFDPESIAGSPDAQDQAFAADCADAHRHVVSSGMAKEHVGRAVSIPDVEGTISVTLSGVIGIASVAGLEGCAGWLENKSDRKRFPHTTQAFLRTNGVF